GEFMRVPVQPLIARIGSRSPTSPIGAVFLNRGSSHGVRPGTIAVYNGVNLLGRVPDRLSPLQCELLPLTNPETKLMIGAVLPPDRLDVSIAQAPKIPLTPRGDGTFIAQADRIKQINVGDEVLLLDDAWPASAQAMRIGTVQEVLAN